MFGNNSRVDQEVADMLGMNKIVSPENKETEFRTDVEGLTADGVVKKGTDEFPIFDIDQKHFMQNMDAGRRRIRMPAGSKAQQYMQQSRYNRDFYVRYKDDNGKEFVRKVK